MDVMISQFDINIPLKQMKTDIGNVKTISIIDPTVARTSMKPPLWPSAAFNRDG